MIKGKIKTELSIESILERSSPYEIFKYYIPGDWEVNEVMCSPLRKDDHPSFLVGNRYGELNFKDFAVSDHKGDVFTFVKLKFGLSDLHSVLKLIDRDLNLSITDGSEVRISPITQISEPEISKKSTLIQVVTRKFLKSELDWWGQYGINEDELRADNVYSIKKAFLNKKLLTLDDLRFAYYYEGMFKIYQPLSDKKRKWLSNVPLTYIDGKENIKDCDVAWVTKSKKEKLILKKLYTCVCSTQNESLACFSQENVDFIKNNSKKQVVLYDSDESGVKSCQEITKKFNFGYCNPPKKYLPLKDFSDICRIYGIGEVEKILKEKQLI